MSPGGQVKRDILQMAHQDCKIKFLHCLLIDCSYPKRVTIHCRYCGDGERTYLLVEQMWVLAHCDWIFFCILFRHANAISRQSFCSRTHPSSNSVECGKSHPHAHGCAGGFEPPSDRRCTVCLSLAPVQRGYSGRRSGAWQNYRGRHCTGPEMGRAQTRYLYYHPCVPAQPVAARAVGKIFAPLGYPRQTAF